MITTACQRYVDKVPPAGEGQRNDSLNRLAFGLLEKFTLSEHELTGLLSDWGRSCSPPLTEAEITKTIASAWRGAHGKGVVGSKVRPQNGNGDWRPANRQFAGRQSPPAKAGQTPVYDLTASPELPAAVPDGARALLRAVFRQGEGIRIVNAVLDAKDEEIPDGPGLVLSREEWLRKLDAKVGDPNGIWSSSKKTGIYISINPMKPGGSKDADVTAHRLALVEFDKELSIQEQWNLYQQSRLPCAAVIYSGGKSVHAWVKVDAADRREYDKRVRQLYEHFQSAGYQLDPQNKNPSRFSRLPNCIRFDRRQELLALNTGCESFSEWQSEMQTESLGPVLTFGQLCEFDTQHDPNTILGVRDGITSRYLCKGGSAWLIAPSGVGKSSLILQMAVCWACGLPAFGITPVSPLRVLFVQAENDDGDLAEAVQGIRDGLDFNFTNERFMALVESNLIIRTESSRTGPEFCSWLQRAIDAAKPHLVTADPFLSFAGIDVSKQDQCSQFLRGWLNPVLKSTGVAIIGVHHVGKPKVEPKGGKSWTMIDHAYAGLGSSELVNWARAIMVVRTVDDRTYELKLTKRGNRAGATHPDGTPTTSIWLRQASKGIYWDQITPPEEPASAGRSRREKEMPDQKGGRPSVMDEIAALNLHDFLAKCLPDGEGLNEIARRLEDWLAKKRKDVSEKTCKRTIPVLVSRGFLEKKEGGKYHVGPNK